MRRTALAAAFLGIASASAHALSGGAAAPAGSAPEALVRVTTVGFTPDDTKYAYLMTDHAISGESFRVYDVGDNATATTGTVGADSRGRWSANYPDVYEIDLSSVTAPGTYAIKVSGPVTATSASFPVEPATALYGQIVANGVTFFQNQRDGADQISGPLDRQPSHLGDAHAKVYQLPHFVHPNRSDRIQGNLHRIGHRTVNVEGGWFDAGDFLKFTHTAAYADLLLSASVRALGSSAPTALVAEAAYGERWLSKMWDQKTKTLYLQVGIGSGNTAHTYYGDHDLWRLPQADDSDNKPKDRFAAAHRPVFRAAAPGHRISPNLAGRVAAAFALAAQNDVTAAPSRAKSELRKAISIYRLAATAHPPHPLATAAPVEYYPEDSWHDDMALGGAEIALAKEKLHEKATPYIKDSAHWVKSYMRHDDSDTFNLYDTSALAESDVYQLLDANPHVNAGLSANQDRGDLRKQFTHSVTRSGRDPFRAAGNYDQFDVDSHTFGLMATAAMYDADDSSSAYQPFATAQRDWLFGSNAWSASFMVGEGSNFPDCMQHQVANLSGSLDGSAPLDLGAVVNGPNNARIFRGGLGSLQEGVRRCPANRSDPYQPYNGRGSRYLDDTRSWQTSEPAIDMTSSAIFAAALEESAA